MRKMTRRGAAQQAALLITLLTTPPTILLTSTLCVAQARGSQTTANAPRALRLSLRIESQSRADPAGGIERTATDVQIDYTCNLLPSKRVVAIDRFRKTANAGGELQSSADLQRPRAVLYVQGRRREIPFEKADDNIREVLAALEAPAYEVVLAADGAETSRRVLPTPAALALMSDAALWNTRFFHAPFHVDRDAWECERTLGAGVEASGTLRYQKSASPRSDGLIEVRVEGSLRGRTERDGTEEVETFEVSGTQSYDPSCQGWVAGDLVMETRLTSREDGGQHLRRRRQEPEPRAALRGTESELRQTAGIGRIQAAVNMPRPCVSLTWIQLLARWQAPVNLVRSTNVSSSTGSKP